MWPHNCVQSKWLEMLNDSQWRMGIHQTNANRKSQLEFSIVEWNSNHLMKTIYDLSQQLFWFSQFPCMWMPKCYRLPSILIEFILNLLNWIWYAKQVYNIDWVIQSSVKFNVLWMTFQNEKWRSIRLQIDFKWKTHNSKTTQHNSVDKEFVFVFAVFEHKVMEKSSSHITLLLMFPIFILILIFLSKQHSMCDMHIFAKSKEWIGDAQGEQSCAQVAVTRTKA